MRKKASASGCRHVKGHEGLQKKTELVKETIRKKKKHNSRKNSKNLEISQKNSRGKYKSKGSNRFESSKSSKDLEISQKIPKFLKTCKIML